MSDEVWIAVISAIAMLIIGLIVGRYSWRLTMYIPEPLIRFEALKSTSLEFRGIHEDVLIVRTDVEQEMRKYKRLYKILCSDREEIEGELEIEEEGGYISMNSPGIWIAPRFSSDFKDTDGTKLRKVFWKIPFKDSRGGEYCCCAKFERGKRNGWKQTDGGYKRKYQFWKCRKCLFEEGSKSTRHDK